MLVQDNNRVTSCNGIPVYLALQQEWLFCGVGKSSHVACCDSDLTKHDCKNHLNVINYMVKSTISVECRITHWYVLFIYSIILFKQKGPDLTYLYLIFWEWNCHVSLRQLVWVIIATVIVLTYIVVCQSLLREAVTDSAVE